MKRGFPGTAGPVRLGRDRQGVAQITSTTLEDAHAGLGFCHARDRALQLLLVRILARGQACELLQDTQEMLELDRLFHRWNLAGDAAEEAAALSERARAAAEAYCRGANLYFNKAGAPWELRMLGYKVEPWTIADIFITAKVAGLVALALAQADMERFIIECVQQGISRERLEELFPGQLGGLDEALIRQVHLPERLVPESLKWASVLPRMMASNNWVIAGNKTRSGKPILCNDPHLEVNRLPAVWYEAVLRWGPPGDRQYAIGATLPGLPGVVIGRTRELAWGVTYAFMDCIDSWIEDCRDGQYRRGDTWHPFKVRTATVRRKKNPPLELRFYENDHGVLNGDPHKPGYYLATRWSCGEQTSAAAIDVTCGLLAARTVAEGRAALGRLANSSWNWVLADRAGNIGYQMCGKLPRRRPEVSGLVPLAGWDPANDWQGFYTAEELPRALNPREGFLVTANQDLNDLGTARPINICMASYRAERIASELARAASLTLEQMQRLQLDLYSTQAQQFMALLRPLLPEFAAKYPEAVRLLESWDLCYRSDSRAASLFEEIYRALVEEVFGSGPEGFGPEVLKCILNDTCLFYDYYGNFDRILLAQDSVWFGRRSRTELYRAALARALPTPLQTYGHRCRVRMRHLLLGGKLPLCFGFDRAFELPGNRATVHQGQIYRAGGRETSFGPSFRMVTDLGTDEVHTTLAGGASDRRFSKWYANKFYDWLEGRYQRLCGLETDTG